MTSDYVAPTRLPDWPFAATDCPLCAARRFEQPGPPPSTADLYWRLKAAEVSVATLTKLLADLDLRALLKRATPEERIAAFEYCHHCGADAPCHCWNDE